MGISWREVHFRRPNLCVRLEPYAHEATYVPLFRADFNPVSGRKIHRRDAESAEGAQRKTVSFCSVLTLCPLRLCGEFSGLHYTQSKTALVGLLFFRLFNDAAQSFLRWRPLV